MKKKHVAAAGALLGCLHGCAGERPTEEENELIQSALLNARHVVDLAKEVILYAAPAFDNKGNLVEDNVVVAEQFAELPGILDEAFANDRFRVRRDVTVGGEQYAAGEHTELGDPHEASDDLFVISDSGLAFPNLFLHEAAHVPYGLHKSQQARELGTKLPRERIEKTIEYRDSPYFVDDFAEYLRFFNAFSTLPTTQELNAYSVDDLEEQVQEAMQNLSVSENEWVEDQMQRDGISWEEDVDPEAVSYEARDLFPGEAMALYGVLREGFVDALRRTDYFERWQAREQERLDLFEGELRRRQEGEQISETKRSARR